MKKISVAIDGPAGAGKSSVAKAVAKRAGYLYLDTGAMYRALTWAVLQANVDLADEKALKSLIHTTDIHMEPGETDRVFVNGTDVTSPIRSAEVTGHVSAVAALPAVREKLVDLQRQIAARGGVILDGRDIGTVVKRSRPIFRHVTRPTVNAVFLPCAKPMMRYMWTIVG